MTVLPMMPPPQTLNHYLRRKGDGSAALATNVAGKKLSAMANSHALIAQSIVMVRRALCI